jgi:hypothetical protein
VVASVQAVSATASYIEGPERANFGSVPKGLTYLLLHVVVAVPLSYMLQRNRRSPYFGWLSAVAVSWWPSDSFWQVMLVWLMFLVLPCNRQ